MAFIAGAGAANVDLLYENMPKIPDIGEEVYTDKFSLQLGGGLPATLINLGRLGIETKIATELGDDMFSAFAREKFCENGVTPVNIYKGNGIPLNITSAIILENDRSFITARAALSRATRQRKPFIRLQRAQSYALCNPADFWRFTNALKPRAQQWCLI